MNAAGTIEVQYAAGLRSPRAYQTRLTRTWDYTRPQLGVIIGAPCDAKPDYGDRLIGDLSLRAVAAGYGGFELGCLFGKVTAMRSWLYSDSDPVGRETDHALCVFVGRLPLVLCAWGSLGAWGGRGRAVVELLIGGGWCERLHILGLGSDGEPLEINAATRALPLLEWEGYR